MELDQYFTPREVAHGILLETLHATPNIKTFVDSSCGSGQLLLAAKEISIDAKCIGIDKDRRNIIHLRKSQPDWLLSTADILLPASYRRTQVFSNSKSCDLLVLNPPFSMEKKRFKEINFEGQQIHCSVAMAHIIQSFKLFSPSNGAVVIIPESVLYSETDYIARKLFAQKFDISKISDLKSSTFSGANVHASAIRIKPKAENSSQVSNCYFPSLSDLILQVSLIRGGLPVHKLQLSPSGVPFIHSTDLKNITSPSFLDDIKRKTSQVMAGNVGGSVIFIPRVGEPKRHYIKAISIKNNVQLSDCVFVIQCQNYQAALTLEKRIQSHWKEFTDLYKGTAARYTTITRLKEWLWSINTIAN